MQKSFKVILSIKNNNYPETAKVDMKRKLKLTCRLGFQIHSWWL